MSLTVMIALLAVLLVALFAAAMALGVFSGGREESAAVKNLLQVQRGAQGLARERAARPAVTTVTEVESSTFRRSAGSTLTLKKRLKFAQLPIPVPAFRAIEVLISVGAFLIVNMKMHIFMAVIALTAGPIVMRWIVGMRMSGRSKRFDADYPQFLMSLVGLLKTGMTAIGAVEAAAQGLEADSLVRQEVELMVERLRVGVSEDRSIGAFGEDIYHPEIELFVQALLLSRRVGGTLSETLERLAKQVRKRQYFRNAAVGAVGMQRGSIWIIVAFLAFIEGYLYWMYPDMVKGSVQSEAGWLVWQFGLFVIIAGIFWVRQVTKIKV